MNRSNFISSAVLALAGALTWGTALSAQTSSYERPRGSHGGGDQERNSNSQFARLAANGEARIIAVQVWARDLDTGAEVRYGVAPENEAVEVDGGRYRIILVGTALIEGDGEEVPINAQFDVAAGNGVSIQRTGANWIDVSTSNERGVVGQVGFSVQGNYDARGALKSGRITFEGKGGKPSSTTPSHDASRQQKSEYLVSILMRGIVDQGFEARRDADLVRYVYTYGYGGVQTVADDLASSVDQRRGGLDPEAVVGRLYRTLLGRKGSDRELSQSDPGFYENVRVLRQQGLPEVVATIVGSVEFRRVQIRFKRQTIQVAIKPIQFFTQFFEANDAWQIPSAFVQIFKRKFAVEHFQQNSRTGVFRQHKGFFGFPFF